MNRSHSRPRRARLGAHLSVAGGLPRAVERALDVDATALQVFVKSARRWRAAPPDRAEALAFRSALAAARLEAATLAHASYLINLAAPGAALAARSVRALADELSRCARYGIPYLVVHPGSHVGAGETAGIERVAASLRRVLRGSDPSVTLLLETTAGQGTSLGHRFEQIAAILERLPDSAPIGVCADTCHLHAAGYDLTGPRGYAATWNAFNRAIGLERLRAFHLNDSRHDRGSRRDRHAHIGEGTLGPAAFRRLLRDPRFAALPMVLETPKGDDGTADVRNLALLRAMLPRSRR